MEGLRSEGGIIRKWPADRPVICEAGAGQKPNGLCNALFIAAKAPPTERGLFIRVATLTITATLAAVPGLL